MSPGRRSVYCSLGLLFVLIHLTAAYSVEEICSRRCLYHRGGVLCNCNARHFTGKRSGPATEAGMYSMESARQGPREHFSPANIHLDESLMPDSHGTLGIHYVTSQELQQKIRDLWGQRRVDHLQQGDDQSAGYTVQGDGENKEQYKTNMADHQMDDPPAMMVQEDVGDAEVNDVRRTPGVGDRYTVVAGGDDAVGTILASGRHLRQLEAALRRVLQGRRRSGLV